MKESKQQGRVRRNKERAEEQLKKDIEAREKALEDAAAFVANKERIAAEKRAESAEAAAVIVTNKIVAETAAYEEARKKAAVIVANKERIAAEKRAKSALKRAESAEAAAKERAEENVLTS